MLIRYASQTIMRNIRLLLLPVIALLLFRGAPGTQTVLTKDIVKDRRVKLLSARISETRGRYLVASFEVLNAPKAEVIGIQFPAHSHTTHETTLINLIRASVDWST